MALFNYAEVKNGSSIAATDKETKKIPRAAMVGANGGSQIFFSKSA